MHSRHGAMCPTRPNLFSLPCLSESYFPRHLRKYRPRRPESKFMTTLSITQPCETADGYTRYVQPTQCGNLGHTNPKQTINIRQNTYNLTPIVHSYKSYHHFMNTNLEIVFHQIELSRCAYGSKVLREASCCQQSLCI